MVKVQFLRCLLPGYHHFSLVRRLETQRLFGAAKPTAKKVLAKKLFGVVDRRDDRRYDDRRDDRDRRDDDHVEVEVVEVNIDVSLFFAVVYEDHKRTIYCTPIYFAFSLWNRYNNIISIILHRTENTKTLCNPQIQKPAKPV